MSPKDKRSAFFGVTPRQGQYYSHRACRATVSGVGPWKFRSKTQSIVESTSTLWGLPFDIMHQAFAKSQGFAHIDIRDRGKRPHQWPILVIQQYGGIFGQKSSDSHDFWTKCGGFALVRACMMAHKTPESTAKNFGARYMLQHTVGMYLIKKKLFVSRL